VKESADWLQVVWQILAPIRHGAGTRHLWVGDTGMGKTTANRQLIDAALKLPTVAIVLTVDEKDPYEAQYKGTYRVDPEALASSPPGPTESRRHIVFRGVAVSRNPDQSVSCDSVAQMAWEIVYASDSKQGVILNLDELADALIPNSQNWEGNAIAGAYRKGRSVGISVIAGIQQPQLLPREAFGLAETMGLFRMDGREADYLRQKRVISQETADKLPNLQIGEFILSAKGARETGDVLVRVPPPKKEKAA
jgi:hypothetical protein